MRYNNWIGICALLLIITLGSCNREDSEPEATEDMASLIVGSYTGEASDMWGPDEDEKSIFISRTGNDKINVAPEGVNVTIEEFDLRITRGDSATLLHHPDEMGITFRAELYTDSTWVEFTQQNPQQSFKGSRN